MQTTTDSAKDQYASGSIAIGGIIRKDTAGPLANSVSGNYTLQQVGASGGLKVEQVDSTGAPVGLLADEQVATHRSPTHFSVAYATASTLTLTSAPTLSQNNQIIRVIICKLDNTTKIIKNGFDGYSFGYVDSTGILTVYKSGVASNEFLATDTAYGVYVRDGVIAQDQASDSDKVTQLNPDSEKRVDPVPLVDTTNVAATTTYYPSTAGFSMDGYRHLNIEGVTSGGVTTTIEATNDPAASPDRIDVTLAGYDMLTNTVGNASFIDKSFLLDFDTLNVQYVRIKSITSDATNAVQYSYRQIA